MTDFPNVHAVYVALGECDLLIASIKSIYPFVEGITVVSALDQDWGGQAVPRDGTAAALLDPDLDSEGKITFVRLRETNQARALNRAMDLRWPREASRRVEPQHPDDSPLEPVDYFWVIDSDEIYERSNIWRLFGYVAERGKPYMQVAAYHYFKTWNYRVNSTEWFTAFVRADRRVYRMRNPKYATVLSKLLWRVPMVAPTLPLRVVGVHRIPLEVGHFHHGSYVGPKSRMKAKLERSPHRDEFRDRWLEEKWEHFSTSTSNFHPTVPETFPSATYIPPENLPREISGYPWPEGYLGT